MEKSKVERLVSYKVGKKIASISAENFFDSLGYVEENAIWRLWKLKDLFGKVLKDMHIWTKDKYTKFTRKLKKPEVKKKIFLKQAHMEDNKVNDSS